MRMRSCLGFAERRNGQPPSSALQAAEASRSVSVAALGALLALAGCFDDNNYDDSRARGDLGKGTFVYGCTNDTDTSCDAGAGVLPRAVAVGSRFDLRFSINSGANPTVITPVTDLVRRVDDAFEVRAPGEFALLAVDGNREVIDIKHMRAADIDEVRVQQKTELPSANLQLDTDESAQLLALPYDGSGVQLGGALAYAWSSSDERLLSVESLPQLNRVRVKAGSVSGKVTLSVELDGQSYDVSVQIGNGKTGLEAGASTDAGAQLDAGGGAESDADSSAAESADAEADAGVDGGAS